MRVARTDAFDKRLKQIADSRAQARIVVAVQRMEEGNFGDCRPLGGGVSETRIHYGPGYRVYHTRIAGQVVVLLLCGDKPTQQRDIALAKELSKAR